MVSRVFNLSLRYYEVKRLLERFSFECRKVICFAFTTLRDWLKKLAPLFHPIRSKTKTNRDLLVRVSPHFASATCNYFMF